MRKNTLTVVKDVIFPTTLKNKIDEICIGESKSYRTMMYRMMAKIYSQQYTKDNYSEIPSTWFYKIFSSPYSRALKSLRNNGVIEGYKTENSDDSYIVPNPNIKDRNGKVKKGLCKKFRITENYYIPISEYYSNENNDDFTEEKIKIKVLKKDKKKTVKETNKEKDERFSKFDLEYTPKSSQKELEDEFLKDISSLVIDVDKLEEIKRDKINSLDMSKYIVGESLLEEKSSRKWVLIKIGKNKPRKKEITEIKNLMNSTGYELFYYKHKFYLDTIENITATVKNDMHISYSDTISRIRNGEFYAKRNETNNRLDTNFTNMPNEFVESIMKDNDLVQMDMCNSQFSLFCHHIDKGNLIPTEDYELFRNLAYDGKLYDYIAEKKGVSRKDAKNGFFEILFGKHTSRTKDKKFLKTVFPSVVKWVDGFKKEKGYKEMSIGLQNIESSIFIDGIYERIKELGLFCLTRHDSVIVRRKDALIVEHIIKKIFEEIGFKGKIIKE